MRCFARMERAVLISMLLALGSAMAATPPAPTLELRHRNALDSTYRLKTITWWLDGKTLATWNGGEEDPTPEVQLRPVTIEPGMHSLAVTAIYEGNSSLFSYVNGYRFRMHARMVIDARPGYVIQMASTAFAETDLTTDWKDRPRFSVEGFPKKAFLDQETLPVEGLPTGSEDVPEIAVVPASGRGEDPAEAVPSEASGGMPGCESAGPIHFGFAGFRLDARARRNLDRLAACLVKHGEMKVRLDGHCDARGSDGFNITLATWRTDSSRRYLVSRGVLPERIEAQAFGEAHPVCQEDTDSCHARNRRVEFVLKAPKARPQPAASLH